MRYSSKQYAQALYEAIFEAKETEVVLDNFVQVLRQNGDLAKHPEIEIEFKRLEMQNKGFTQAQITTAKEVEINSKLLDTLNSVTKSKMEIQRKVDQNIVGGIVVRVDDKLVDGSLKSKLNGLSRNLKQ